MAAAAKKMTDAQLAALIDSEFASAQGIPGGDVSNDRALLLDYYMQRLFGDEQEGSSKIVTSDVADIVDGLMPSLLRIFTTADNLVSFDPVDERDIEQAAQESDYVNYVFFKQNPAFLILFTWFFDALLQKNGIVKAYADETEEVTQESYKGLSEMDLLQLMQDPELEPVERSESTAQVPGLDGVTMTEQVVHDITFRRVKKYTRICVDNVAPENYRISSDASSVQPRARMVGEEADLTRSKLVEMGLPKDKVYALPAVGSDVASSQEKRARNNASDDQQNAGTGAGTDKSQEKVRVRAGFLQVDFDGDGRAELRYVLKAGDVVFENEIADRQHFHVLSPQPMPHKHFGRAAAEKGVDIQRVKSELVRQTHDNIYRVNRPGHAVWEMGIGDSTLDDILTERIGRVVRFSRPVSESYQPMTVPFTAGASFPLIDYWDKAKRERTGVSPDSQGLDPDALKNIQMSVMRDATDMGRMKIEMIARIFAETGIKSLFLHIHELLQKHQNKRCVVQLRNKWVQVDPTAWHSRKDMTVNIGLGIGTREANLVHLEAIWGKQMALLDKGGANVLVTAGNLYNTAAEVVKNANLKNPGLYFSNPGKTPLGAPTSEQEALMRQQQQLQAREQQLDAERQANTRAKLQLEAREQMFKLRMKIAELQQERDSDAGDKRLEIERLKNELTEMELKYDRDVPGSKV